VVVKASSVQINERECDPLLCNRAASLGDCGQVPKQDLLRRTSNENAAHTIMRRSLIVAVWLHLLTLVSLSLG
jgi:hypothetical protein